MKHKYKATCSQCGKRFFGDTSKEMLDKVRVHMWKQHADWMRRRIKQGLRKKKQAYHAPGNPFIETVKKILNPSWTGFAERALIEKVTGRPYLKVREEALDAFVAQLFDGFKGKE